MSTTTTTSHDDLLTAIRTQARIGNAVCELETARKQINQVSLSVRSLLHAGLSNDEAMELLRLLREASCGIADAARRVERNAMLAQEAVLDLAENLAK